MADINIDTSATEVESSVQGAAGRKPHPLILLLGMSGGLGVILVLLLMVFILPALKGGPHDLPVGIVGLPSDVTEFEQALHGAAPGAYAPQRFESESELRTAIFDRDIVGGFVLGGSDVHALVAGAGSATISGAISNAVEAVGQATGGDVTVEDVVPLPEADPTGIGIGGLAFPLVFGGIVPVVAFRKIFPRSMIWYLAGLIGFAMLGGIVVASILTFSFGSIEAAFWPVAASMAMGIAALALPLAGLQSVFGAKGFTIGAMTMMFLGNPLAGISTTSAWLPSGLGTVGQILPPGAAGALVRSAAYFHGAGGLTAALTLVLWSVVGLVLFAVGARRTPVVASTAPSLVG
ncbi:ABC transporter permease [Rhodococcus chondri]|uniref:ABC transporter permease n=1 Tax=Rhodococcus chondri TaxID=3065941 RepID=A0ABU7JU29_9NOCA|nr:ABC transporter permease [Rhodococcus sp. CC-R104]MEE2033429.1 ABC transporter permease [Rhodococcus sp. CC-R104]